MQQNSGVEGNSESHTVTDIFELCTQIQHNWVETAQTVPLHSAMKGQLSARECKIAMGS